MAILYQKGRPYKVSLYLDTYKPKVSLGRNGMRTFNERKLTNLYEKKTTNFKKK